MHIDPLDAFELLNEARAGVVVHAADTSITYANPHALKTLRLTERQVLGKDAMDPAWKFLDALRRPLAPEDFPVNRVLREERAIHAQVVGVIDQTSEDVTWVLVDAYPKRGPGGAIDRVVVSFVDITSQQQDIPFDQIVAQANEPVLVTEPGPLRDGGPRILYVNDALLKATGYTRGELVGQTPRIFQGEDTCAETRERLHAALQTSTPITETLVNYTKTGKRFHLELSMAPLLDAAGNTAYFAAIQRDVTAEKARESSLHRQATLDPLTGLLNRRGLDESAEKLMALAQRTGTRVAAAAVDIDLFRGFNDAYGHGGGDAALRHVAHLMRETLRRSDVIARSGGDEFLAILPDTDSAGALHAMEKLRTAVRTVPLRLDSGARVPVTLSIGVAAAAPPEQDFSGLAASADQALYRAKNSGRNRIEAATSRSFPASVT